MGYSISVKFNTEKERDSMSKFLVENIGLFNDLAKTEGGNFPFNFHPATGEDLSYAPEEKNLLGFHGSIIPRYIWNLCAWMTVKSQFRDDDDGSMYFYYDDEKSIVTFDVENKKDTVVDKDGLRVEAIPTAKDKFLYSFFDIGSDKKKQKELFVELNGKWLDYVTHNNSIKAKIR